MFAWIVFTILLAFIGLGSFQENRLFEVLRRDQKSEVKTPTSSWKMLGEKMAFKSIFNISSEDTSCRERRSNGREKRKERSIEWKTWKNYFRTMLDWTFVPWNKIISCKKNSVALQNKSSNAWQRVASQAWISAVSGFNLIIPCPPGGSNTNMETCKHSRLRTSGHRFLITHRPDCILPLMIFTTRCTPLSLASS